MTVDIENFIRHCELCQKNKGHPKKRAGKLQLFPASKPFAITHLDIYGPLTETLSGNKYVLVSIDRFTRWLELIAMPDMLEFLSVPVNFFSNFVVVAPQMSKRSSHRSRSRHRHQRTTKRENRSRSRSVEIVMENIEDFPQPKRTKELEIGKATPYFEQERKS